MRKILKFKESYQPRFTGSDIPAELIKDLKYLGDLVVGYDHTDKGFMIQFSRSISSGAKRELAQMLKIEPWQIEVDDEDSTLYHVSE